MTIKVHIDSMRDAEHFSDIIRNYPNEITLNAGHFCVDPKSVLGVLAIMYADRDGISLDTGDMEDECIPELSMELAPFLCH